MADSPLNEKQVHALAGAVAGNIKRLRQSIDELRQIHNRWKGSDETSINLIAQLTGLKSNLGNMQDWVNYAAQDLHSQLLSDLDVLMHSCGLLVRHLDVLIARLRQPDHNAIDCAIRLKYAIGGRSMDRLRNVAQRQNEAVTLLLAACKCHASAQRKILLHKTRQIRKDDAKSLKILARSSKFNGGCMSALTRMSRMIQWLRRLFYSKLTQQEPVSMPTEEDYDIEAAAIRSEAIDRTLQDDATSLRRETKLVLMGNPTSGKELIMQQMKVLYAAGYYSTEERKTYRYGVRSTLRLLIHAMIDLLKDTGINLPSELNQHFAILLHEVETVDMHHPTPSSIHSIHSIWSSPEFSHIYIRNFEIDFPQYASYFAQEAPRIAHPDYLPSDADIIRLNQSHRGIKELRFNWDGLDVHLFNIHGYIPEHFRKRWFHQLEGATSLVYTVDVSQYDRPYLGQPTSSQLLDDFANFESWASNEKFASSSIILLLNNFTRFREKLPYSPLESFFPDYVPSDTDPETSARQYVLRRFKDVNRNRLSIYSFWVDLEFTDNQPLYAALKNTLQHIQQQRARSGVENGSSTSTSEGRSSGTGLASRLLRSRSGTVSRKGAGSSGSRITSPTSSGK